MNKQDRIYQILDKMVQELYEEKKRLARKVETGQLTNPERHEILNQLYVKRLCNAAQAIAEL